MNKRVKEVDREERKWIKAVVEGDKDAFDFLVLRYKDRVFNLCFRILGDYEEASDAAQLTFVKAYMGLKSFRFNSSFSTWLYTIAINTCKNRLKSSGYKQRKKEVSLLNNGESKNGRIKMVSSGPSPLDTLLQKERERLIQSAIDMLPEEFRIMVVLHDIKGLSYKEISIITGRRIGTVKSRLARARKKLMNILKEVIKN